MIIFGFPGMLKPPRWRGMVIWSKGCCLCRFMISRTVFCWCQGLGRSIGMIVPRRRPGWLLPRVYQILAVSLAVGQVFPACRCSCVSGFYPVVDQRAQLFEVAQNAL